MEKEITFFITSADIEGYKIPERFKKVKELSFFLNEKNFRPSHTGLTYRKINHLSNGLIKKGDQKSGAWAKYTFKEIIFIFLVEELRKYGFVDKQLAYLRKSFFDKKYKEMSDIVILQVFVKVRIILIINSKGYISFQNEFNFDKMREEFKSCLVIDFNDLIMGAWEKLGQQRFAWEFARLEDVK